MQRKSLGFVLVLVTLLTACAVKHAPQISAETTWKLNTASQLSQINKDYTQFFTDVGDAQRNGYLTSSQVSTLNIVGHNSKTSIEIANQEWSAYVSGTGTKVSVINALLKAEEIMLQLTSQRASMEAK